MTESVSGALLQNTTRSPQCGMPQGKVGEHSGALVTKNMQEADSMEARSAHHNASAKSSAAARTNASSAKKVVWRQQRRNKGVENIYMRDDKMIGLLGSGVGD